VFRGSPNGGTGSFGVIVSIAALPGHHPLFCPWGLSR
jgi:hypothetical protein